MLGEGKIKLVNEPQSLFALATFSYEPPWHVFYQSILKGSIVKDLLDDAV